MCVVALTAPVLTLGGTLRGTLAGEVEAVLTTKRQQDAPCIYVCVIDIPMTALGFA